MFKYLYKHWAAMSIPIAIFVTMLLIVNFQSLGLLLFVVWIQFTVYLIHQFEEHAYPGGFKNYINTRVFDSQTVDTPLDDSLVFWINIPIIWILFPVAAILSQTINIQYGIFLPLFGLFNATLHIIIALRKREYNPGLGVSCLLNYPTGIWTLWLFNQEHLLDTLWVTIAFILSLILHILMVYSVRHRVKSTK